MWKVREAGGLGIASYWGCFFFFFFLNNNKKYNNRLDEQVIDILMSSQVFVATLFIVYNGKRRRVEDRPMVLKDQIFLQFRKKDISGDIIQ